MSHFFRILLLSVLILTVAESNLSARHRRRGCCSTAPTGSPVSPAGAVVSKGQSDVATAASATRAAASATQPSWLSLFDGKTLGKWQPSEFGTQGKIDAKDGRLVIGFGDGCSGVTWKGDFPKLDYEIGLEAMRVEGTDFFCGLTFPVRDTCCSFIVGGWGGSVVGISSIDGEDAAANDTTQVKSFDNGKWYAIRVRVTGDRIRCWIDNERIVDQPIKDRKLSVRSEVEASEPLGLAAWKTTAAVRAIQYRRLSADEAQEDKK